MARTALCQSAMVRLLIATAVFTIFDGSNSRRVQPKDVLERYSLDSQALATSQGIAPAPEASSASISAAGQPCNQGEPCGAEDNKYILWPNYFIAKEKGGQKASVEEKILKRQPGSDSALVLNIGKFGFGPGQCIALVIALLCISACGMMLFYCRGEQNNRNELKHKGKVIYEWEQQESKMMMYIRFPEGTDKDNLDIRITPRHLSIGRTDKTTFIKGQLYHTVEEEQSSWIINKKGELQICLIKAEPAEWSSVFLSNLHTPRQMK